MIASELAAAVVRLHAAGVEDIDRVASVLPRGETQPILAAYTVDGTDRLSRALAAGAGGSAAWPWRVVGAVLQARGVVQGRGDTAALIGAEVAARLAARLGAEHDGDPAGTVGVIGAAVTAALLDGAPADQIATAVGIAASLSAGLRVHSGTSLSRMHAGFAAAGGTLAATLARHGVTASPTALEGPRGLFAAYGVDQVDGVWAGLGETWLVWDIQDGPTAPPPVASGPVPELARFASSVRVEELPEPARHAARRTLSNVVGLAIDAAGHPAVSAVAAGLAELGLDGSAQILGRTETASPYAAALLMGYAMHVEDFDDTHLATVLHPGAPVVAAALSAAQLESASGGGSDVLAGVVAGVEVGSRLGLALGPGHFDRGWHVSGTVGHIAAAAAAARVLRLDPEQTAHALGIASTMASGITEQLGSMTKALHVGRSAANGLQAALLARAGIAGAPDPFGAPGGLADLMSPSYDPPAALAGLGESWELVENAFKPYSCGIVSHPVIDAALAARAAGLRADDVVRVVATVRPVVLEVMGVREPADGLQSKFSVYHCFAVGLIDGGAGPAQYTDARATDARVVGLRRRVEVVTDPEMPKDACRVEVWDGTGTRHSFVVEHASGSAAAPMTDAQLERKFLLLTEPVLGEAAAELWNASMTIDRLPGVDELFERAVKA